MATFSSGQRSCRSRRSLHLPTAEGLQLGSPRAERRRSYDCLDATERNGRGTGWLDEWRFPIHNEEAHAAWTARGRQQWLQGVQNSGGFGKWLLDGLGLEGMDDKRYLLGLRFGAGVALLHSSTEGSEEERKTWRKRKQIAEEIEKDLPRTFPGHPYEAEMVASSRDIVRMLCCARNVAVGYTQGLNFTAFVLSCAMGCDEAFWCLTALAERVAGHFVTRDGAGRERIDGLVADCECVTWLAGRLEPKLVDWCSSREGLIAFEPLCTLLSSCGLPVDATLQCWRAILHSSSPRIYLIRILAQFLRNMLDDTEESATELPEIRQALQKTFQRTYDAEVVLSAAKASAELIPDLEVQQKLQEIQQRLQISEAESSTRRQLQSRMRLKQLLRKDTGNVRHNLLREMQALWKDQRRQKVSQSNLLKLLPAERLDLVGVQSSTWQDFLSSVFVDLDSPHSGGEVLLKHCLIAVALLLGETLEEKASAIFSMLEFNGLCAQADFEELAEAAGQEALARKWLDSNEITEDGLDAKMFHKALLALPSVAIAALESDADSFSVSFTSSSGTLLPKPPKWVPDEQKAACQLCFAAFTCCRRRHHCRACGRLVCRQCCHNRLELPFIGYPDPVRVCDECSSVLSPTLTPFLVPSTRGQ